MRPALVHYLPFATTALAVLFAVMVLHRWRERGGPHLLWWGIGIAIYGLGTLTEAATTLLGWHPAVFRAWYISGALLGGAPLAQGTAYLLLPRHRANAIALVLTIVVAVAATCVLLSPLDASLAEPYRLSGRVLEWQWVRAFSPFINSYAALFLIGGAIASALRYRKQGQTGARVTGNALIALGAILPGIGGGFTRFGYVEVLYVTELVGLLLILAGYRLIVNSPAPAARLSAVTSP